MNSGIYNMDCIEAMKEFPDNFFELAIVDPPYGIRMDGGQIGINGSGKAKQYKQKDWDKEIPPYEYFYQMQRVSKNQIVWGGNYFLTYLYPTPCFLVWYKDKQGEFFADAELAWTSFKSAVRVFKWTWHGMIQQDMKNKEVRIHPTQKPIKLYEWLLMNYAKEGDKVLDTHLGSGSSAIAAHRLGFEFWGYEIDKDYFEAAKKRIGLEKTKLSLF